MRRVKQDAVRPMDQAVAFAAFLGEGWRAPMDDETRRTTPEHRLVHGEAWRDFCDRLKAVGERILADDFPASGADRAEGFRHLTRLSTCALQWFVEFHDGEFPAFHRYDDDAVKWGGPNADNHYLRAKIDPTQSYRLRFDPRGVRELIISTPEGDMQLEQYRVFEERHLTDLRTGADGQVEIVLSPAPAGSEDVNWITLHPGVDHVLVRVYVADWERDAVPTLSIERIGNEGGAPARLEPAVLAERLDQAAHWIEHTVLYWHRFLATRRDAGPANVLAPPRAVPGGAADILYGGGWWNLDDDHALLIECEVPRARYWSFQLYSMPWFESLDIANRISSLNREQMQIDDDGSFRVVVAAADPGIPNWLDTEGRTEGLVSYRWVWSEPASTPTPAPTARCVALADLRRHLPPTTPTCTPEARRAQITRRRRALAHRFRR